MRCLDRSSLHLQAGSLADFSTADLASLGDLEGPAPSLGALYGRSASRIGGLQRMRRSEPGSIDDEQQQQQPAAADHAAEQQGLRQRLAGVGATPQSWPAAHAVSPLLCLSPSAPAAAQSDVFKSANLRLWSPTQPAAMESSGADQPPAAGISSSHSSWRDDPSSLAGASQPRSRPQSAGSLRRQRQSQEAGGPAGSYAAAWRRQSSSTRPHSAASPARIACSTHKAPSLQAERSLQPAAAGSELAAMPSTSAAGSLQLSFAEEQSDLAPAELASAQVAALLEELQREQRISSTLLQQLHDVQRQLEEAAAMAAAAAAVQQPPAPGVQHPADFNGLLAGEAEVGRHVLLLPLIVVSLCCDKQSRACGFDLLDEPDGLAMKVPPPRPLPSHLAALQLERQQCAALRQQLQLQAQQTEEAQLVLEARLHTQQLQLLVAAARQAGLLDWPMCLALMLYLRLAGKPECWSVCTACELPAHHDLPRCAPPQVPRLGAGHAPGLSVPAV